MGTVLLEEVKSKWLLKNTSLACHFFLINLLLSTNKRLETKLPLKEVKKKFSLLKKKEVISQNSRFICGVEIHFN